MALPKISILTPAFNQGNFIEKNILSVLNQDYAQFEHIIIDGGSSDNTVAILKKYPHLKWVSEKDNGQADALNKGLAKATGDIIGWINSDDFYEPGIFTQVAKEFEDPAANWIIANVNYFYEDAQTSRPQKSSPITHGRLLKDPDIVKQPGTFFRKAFIERAGGWDPSLHMVMDYDLWIRLAKMSEPKMVDACWANFTLQSDQKTLGKNILRQYHEMRSVMIKAGAPKYYMISLALRKYRDYFKYSTKSFLIKIGLISEKYRSRRILDKWVK